MCNTLCDREISADSDQLREEVAQPTAEQLTPSRIAAHHAVLVFASMVGLLFRIGLDALATYDVAVVFPLLWAQGVGCGIMGLSLANRNRIINVYPPLYTALTTGVAGSVTTFSSWMLGGWQAFANYNAYDRQGLHDTVDGFAYTLTTLAVSLATLSLGEHTLQLSTPSVRHRRTSLFDIWAILLAAVAYAIALILYFLAPNTWRHDVTFPLLLAPPGAIARYVLSKLNAHPRFQHRFPLGTFIANLSATFILAGAFVASHDSNPRCDALNALQQGFCGCLSTVSTFCVELRTIRGWRWKVAYGGASVLFGHLTMLAVVSGSEWTRHDGLGAICQG